MRLENIINMWDPLQRDPRGKMFVLFSIYIFPQYVTLDLFNFRFNLVRKGHE